MVGKAGTGKTYALGVARHAWQLDGYKVVGAAPTGIATVCLGSEGFEHVRTVDRLLAELDQEGDPRGRRGAGDEALLDARTVLVVDEAGMLGSRKLVRLLDHAHQVGAKVVLVGDDRRLAAIARRDSAKRLAVDTAAPLALRQMSKRQLRAERDRVAALLRDAPPGRARLLAHTTGQRQRAEQGLADATAREEAARDRMTELGQRAGRLLHRRELAEARDRHTLAQTAAQLGRQQADRAADRRRQARRTQQEHLAWHERRPDLLAGDRARARELAWRGWVYQRAIELERPGWLRELGGPPATVKGQRAWRQAVDRVVQYRERYGISDPDRALGLGPRHGDLEQRRHHRATHQAIERLHERQRTMRERRRDRHERAHADQPRTRPGRADQPHSARADERQRGGRERGAG